MLKSIKYLLNYNIYIKYNNILDKLYSNNKELNTLYTYIKQIYDKYPNDISLEEYKLYVLSKVPDKDIELYTSLLEEMESTDTSTSVLEDILQEAQQKQHAYELALLALEVSEGRKDYSELQVLTDKLNSTESVVDASMSFVTNDLHELHQTTVAKPGLRWRLDTLNRMLGSLRPGDFGFIFARPETGKTTFLASEVTNFAQQACGPILWLNNEEQGSKVQLRCYQAMLGIDLVTLFSDLDGNKQKFMEHGGDKIKIFDSAAIHRTQVERLCKAIQPSLIIIDQIDKIKGFQDDREDLRLGAIYIWARELAKTYCPVIGVSQADASGEGKKWLTMENVANAKTAKQAEADWILGIGKVHNDADQFRRFLHLSKNKLAGDPDTDPDLRHGKQAVQIIPSIARYKDEHV